MLHHRATYRRAAAYVGTAAPPSVPTTPTSSPITRASGKKSSITRRWVKNDRLNHVGYLWAFSAITASPGAKAHYRRRRDEHGDWHAAAQHNLFNRMIGQLYHCLQKHELFDEQAAYPPQLAAAV